MQRSGVGNLEFILGHGSFRMSIKYTDRDVEQPVGHISLKFRGGIQMRYKNLSVFCTYTEFKATGMSEITKKVEIEKGRSPWTEPRTFLCKDIKKNKPRQIFYL